MGGRQIWDLVSSSGTNREFPPLSGPQFPIWDNRCSPTIVRLSCRDGSEGRLDLAESFYKDTGGLV